MHKVTIQKSKRRKATKKQKGRNIVAFIPARGGSKGIIDKNIINIAGYPLIAHSILTLKAVGIKEIWVSTDNKRIGKTASLYGAKVIRRPEELAEDDSPTEEAISHFLSKVECDIVIMVQATSPMLTAEELDRGISKFFIGGYDSVFSVVKTNDVLIWKANKYSSVMRPINYVLKERGFRQTRANFILIETGGFYIFTKKAFLKKKCRIAGKVGYSEVSFWNSFQVDNKNDLNNIVKLMRRDSYG